MDTDKSKMQLEHTVKGDNLKYFKAVAYAREQTKSFAGESKRKGVAKLKRCDFSVSPNGKYMTIWKKSDNNKVEYSVYDWKKLRKAYKNAKGDYLSFNSDAVRKLCLNSCKENKTEVAERSFQGIAVDNSKNIVMTSGNDKKEAGKPGSDQYIALLYKKWESNKYSGTEKIKLEQPQFNKDDWMRNLVAEKVGINDVNLVPWLEIEGANVIGDRVFFAVGIVSNKKCGDGEDNSWRMRSFIFSRKLNEVFNES